MFVAEHPKPRGFSFPSLWQWLVLGAVICGAWVLWSETRHRRLIPGIALLPDDSTERMQSIESLVRDGDLSVPLLLRMVVDPDPKTRRDALLGLGRIEPPTDEIREAVRARLSDDDAKVRVYAFSAYKLMSRDDGEFAELAVGLLLNPDDAIRGRAREFLEEAGPEVVPALIRTLNAGSAPVRISVMEILRRRGLIDRRLNIDVIPAARALMQDPDAEVRRLAIEAVVDWEAARPDEALAWLRDDDLEVAWQGFRATDWSLPESVEGIPDIIRLIQNNDGARFRSLIWALRATKSAGRAAVPLLLKLMNSPDELPRLAKSYPGGSMERELIETLADIGCEPDELTRLATPHVADERGGGWARAILSQSAPEEARRQVGLLIGQLESDQPSILESALSLLLGYRSQAQAAVPALTQLAGAEDKKTAASARSLLIAIRPDAGAPLVPGLLSQLEPEQLDRSKPWHPVVQTLGAIGPSAKAAIPALRKILDASPPMLSAAKDNRGLDWLRLNVILALGRIGCHDPQVIELLRGLLKVASWRDRAAAAEALSSPGMRTEAVLRDLVAALRDQEGYVRGNAALAIRDLPGDRTLAVDALADALSDDDVYVRTAAAIALGQIGAGAAPAVERLRDAVRDPMNAFSNGRRLQLPSAWGLRDRDDGLYQFRSVQTAARWALSKIEREDAPTNRNSEIPNPK